MITKNAARGKGVGAATVALASQLLEQLCLSEFPFLFGVPSALPAQLGGRVEILSVQVHVHFFAYGPSHRADNNWLSCEQLAIARQVSQYGHP